MIYVHPTTATCCTNVLAGINDPMIEYALLPDIDACCIAHDGDPDQGLRIAASPMRSASILVEKAAKTA